MSETYTKTDLIKELAASARISRRRADVVLETLRQVAYREARQGFAVPGICRLAVVHRKARLVRNPQTNETLLIAEHDALRIRPVKRAKDAIAPTPRALVQIVPEPTTPAPESVAEPLATAHPPPTSAEPDNRAAPPAAPAPAAPDAAAPTAVVSAPAPAAELPAASSPAPEDGQFISFRCKNCSQEIEAPLEMVGAPNECPSCGEELIVPYTSDPGTIWFQERATSPEKLPATSSAIAALKGRTIRIELPDDV